MPLESDTVFGIIHRGMVHGSDIIAPLNQTKTSTEPFHAGIGIFGAALEQWLPCSGNGSFGRKMNPQANDELTKTH